MNPSTTVSFQQITKILELTDEMNISREAIEIPLAPENPGVVRRLSNGKIEIVVDAALPFENWVKTVPGKVAELLASHSDDQDEPD